MLLSCILVLRKNKHDVFPHLFFVLWNFSHSVLEVNGHYWFGRMVRFYKCMYLRFKISADFSNIALFHFEIHENVMSWLSCHNVAFFSFHFFFFPVYWGSNSGTKRSANNRHLSYALALVNEPILFWRRGKKSSSSQMTPSIREETPCCFWLSRRLSSTNSTSHQLKFRVKVE